MSDHLSSVTFREGGVPPQELLAVFHVLQCGSHEFGNFNREGSAICIPFQPFEPIPGHLVGLGALRWAGQCKNHMVKSQEMGSSLTCNFRCMHNFVLWLQSRAGKGSVLGHFSCSHSRRTTQTIISYPDGRKTAFGIVSFLWNVSYSMNPLFLIFLDFAFIIQSQIFTVSKSFLFSLFLKCSPLLMSWINCGIVKPKMYCSPYPQPTCPWEIAGRKMVAEKAEYKHCHYLGQERRWWG